ncbi:hypothetical protein ACI5KX_07600 [Erythrobacter sp. GH1-10]|uniref:hypothetical protein n=1 Tax=Erythrobacter sp. GH1-10 TaxID=3349334 RepID=UPI003877C1DB
MKKTSLAVATIAVAVFPVAPSLAQGNDVHVSGQGRALKERTFSVNVFVNADGSASGQAQLVRRDFPTNTPDKNKPIIEKVNVTCGNRVDANTIVFGGEIERSNSDGLPTTRYFVVRDNGNPGAGTDEISFLVPTSLGAGDPLFCLNLPASAFQLVPIENGNLKIRG